MKIYSIPKTYKGVVIKEGKYPTCKVIEGKTSYILNKLDDNHGYHLRIDPIENTIIYGDFDHCPNQEIFNNFVDVLASYFEVNKNEISITLSNKINELSYHWTIPSIESNCKSIHKFMKDDEFASFKSYVDLTIYCPKWFRLPNQTNEEKPFVHKIVNGTMKDFLIHYTKKATSTMIIKEEENIVEDIVIAETTPCTNINETLIENLDDEFHSGYLKWCRMAWIFKSLGYPFSLFLEKSRGKQFISSNDCLKCWNSQKISKLTEGLLHNILKQNDPEHYASLNLRYDIPVKVIDYKITQIEQRYLISLDNQNLDDTNDVLTNNINEFFLDPEIKSLNIKSPYDTGKTKLLEKIFTKYNPQRILWLSYRKTLTNDILGSFAEKFNFKDYQDKQYDADRLIIQLESSIKLKPKLHFEDEEYSIPKFDLVIIDEIESILSHFNSPTFKNKSKETFEFIAEIIKTSTKLITLDGDMNDRSYNYINSFGGSRNIVNSVKINQRSFIIDTDKNVFIKSISDDLHRDKKVVIASMSSKQCSEIETKIKSEHPDKTILIYTGQTDDANKEDLKDVKTKWATADLLLYSPTIESGVNFDVEHFDKMYGIVCLGSTSQRAFLQMLSRVRKIKCSTINILNLSFNSKLNNLTKYNQYFYDEVKQHMISLDIVKMNEVMKDGTIAKQLSLYDTNHIYNKIEELYKHDFYFLAYLEALIISKGHTLKINETKKKTKIISDDDIIDEEVEDILLSVEDIDRVEYDRLLWKQQESQATEQDKLKIKKYVFKRCLGVDKLNTDLIKYYDFQTIKKYVGLIDTKNIRTSEDNQYKEEVKKIELLSSLITDIGFQNMYDRNTSISATELFDRMKVMETDSEIFKNDKASRILFNCRSIFKSFESSKAFLGCVNSILEPYSLKVQSKQKECKGKKFYVYLLSNIKGREHIDELLQYRINKGNELHDSTQIRKFITTHYYKDLMTSDGHDVKVDFLD